MKLDAHHSANTMCSNGLFSYSRSPDHFDRIFRVSYQPHPARTLCPEDDQYLRSQTSAPMSFPNWNLGLWALHPVELPCRMAAGFGEMGFECKGKPVRQTRQSGTKDPGHGGDWLGMDGMGEGSLAVST